MYSLTEFSEKTGIKLEKLEKQIREDKNFWNERTGKPKSDKQIWWYKTHPLPPKILLKLMEINKITFKKLGVYEWEYIDR